MFKSKRLVFFWLCFCHLYGVFADTDAVKSVSVTVGDSVTLNISLAKTQKADQILWKIGAGRSLIAQISREFNVFLTYDGTDGRFRDRLKLDNQTGSLTIINTRTTDSGLYEVTVRNSSSETTYSFTVTVYNTTSPGPQTTSQIPSQSPSHPTSESLIVPISAAAGSLLIVAAVGMIWICKKHRKTDQDETHPAREEEITYANPTFYKKHAHKSQEDEVVYASVVTRR